MKKARKFVCNLILFVFFSGKIGGSDVHLNPGDRNNFVTRDLLEISSRFPTLVVIVNYEKSSEVHLYCNFVCSFYWWNRWFVSLALTLCYSFVTLVLLEISSKFPNLVVVVKYEKSSEVHL